MPRLATLATVLVWFLSLPASAAADPPVVHSVSDISQEFTFYMDGRFHRQYLAEVGRDQRNWGTLHKLDLSNANLLILTGGDSHIPYSEASVDHVEAFVGYSARSYNCAAHGEIDHS